MQQHQQYIDRRRPRFMNHSNKTTSDDFYTKLERIRSTAAASSSKFSETRQQFFISLSMKFSYLYKKDDHD